MTESGKRSDRLTFEAILVGSDLVLCCEGGKGKRGREREAVNRSYPNRSCDSGSKEQQHKFLLQKRDKTNKSRGPGRRGFRAKQRRLKGSPQQRRV